MQCVVSNPISMRWIGHLFFGMRSVPATHKFIIYIHIIVLKIMNVCGLVKNNTFKNKSVWRPTNLSMHACMCRRRCQLLYITIVPPFCYAKLMLTFKDKLARPVPEIQKHACRQEFSLSLSLSLSLFIYHIYIYI